MSSEIRIIIADDHPIVRQGLVALLDDQEDMRVLAELNNGREAIAKYREVQPDLTIVDIALSCGFSSQSSFTTAFRKYTGVTPKGFRQRL